MAQFLTTDGHNPRMFRAHRLQRNDGHTFRIPSSTCACMYRTFFASIDQLRPVSMGGVIKEHWHLVQTLLVHPT
jgi:hypothetical protein